MWSVTVKLMRNSLRMLIPAGVAIVIGTTFIASTFLFGNSLNRSMRDLCSAGFGGANYEVSADSTNVSESVLSHRDLERIAGVDGVEGVRAEVSAPIEITASGRHVSTVATPMSAPASIMVQRLVQGSWPDGDQEIAIPKSIADRSGISLGDQVEVRPTAVDATQAVQSLDLTVTATLEDNYYQYYGGSAVVTQSTLLKLRPGYDSLDSLPVGSLYLLVATSGDVSVQTVLSQVNALLPQGFRTVSRAEAEDAQMKWMSGDSGVNVITQFLLVFGGIAMFVAALVIVNTFQVLVAQRRRTLALLRVIGATRGQLYGSVIAESALLGLVSSLAGVGAAVGLIAVVSSSGVQFGDMTFMLIPSWTAFVIPMALGVTVTVLASLSSARAATTVSPLEALQPLETWERRRSGRLRLAVGITCMVAGLTGGAFALLESLRYLHDGTGLMADRFGAVLLGAMLSVIVVFVGLLMTAVHWIPLLLRGVGAVVSHLGSSAAIASANIQRNRRRVAATGAALLIGVTLVSCLGAGAASAKTSMTAALGTRYSVDMQVSGWNVNADTLSKIAAVDGVTDARLVSTGQATIRLADGGTSQLDLFAMTPSDARAVMNVPAAADRMTDGTVVLSEKWLDSMDAASRPADGSTVAVTPATSGESHGDGSESTDLKLAVADFRRVSTGAGMPAIMTPDTFHRLTDRLGADATGMQVWASIDGNATPSQIMDAVQEALQDDAGIQVTGSFVERASWDQMVDMALMALVALLAVAVLIAVIGVANTLSLSVIERTRESATLRAIGMTRGQLRASLAIEALLISTVTGVVGVLLGVAFGWLGSMVMFSQFDVVRLSVDWTMIGVILAATVVCALLASVMPARRAVRTPPVEALAEA